MAVGDKVKALENLEAYAKRVPSDATAEKMIEAIRNGSIQVKKVTP